MRLTAQAAPVPEPTSLALGLAGVAARELVDQHVHRPAIGDDMVQGQQQHVLVGVELEQLNAQQRAVAQVEGCAGVGFDPCAVLDFTVGGC